MRLLGILAILIWMGLTNTVDARRVTGWKKGQKTKINLVTVGGVELEETTARAFREMAKAAAKRGIKLAIRSGFRSHEKQKELYTRFKRGWGHLAAKPGYSNHQNGKAVDIYIDDYDVYEWLLHHAYKYGFKKTVKREAWHWEYVGKAKAKAGRTRHARR